MSAVTDRAGSATSKQILTEAAAEKKGKGSKLNKSSGGSKVAEVAKESLSSSSSQSSEKKESKLNKPPVVLSYEKEMANRKAHRDAGHDSDCDSLCGEGEYNGVNFLTCHGEGVTRVRHLEFNPRDIIDIYSHSDYSPKTHGDNGFYRCVFSHTLFNNIKNIVAASLKSHPDLPDVGICGDSKSKKPIKLPSALEGYIRANEFFPTFKVREPVTKEYITFSLYLDPKSLITCEKIFENDGSPGSLEFYVKRKITDKSVKWEPVPVIDSDDDVQQASSVSTTDPKGAQQVKTHTH